MINGYENTLTDLIELLESSRRAAARSVNAIMTATYWQIGRRIVELEQGGEKRAEYGAAVLKRLSGDLTARFGKGFLELTYNKCVLFISNGRFARHRLANLI